jgi:FlgD Ig-like domain
MRKIGVTAFVALALATVAAFFLIQHLKVSTPLVAGNPVPFPPTINPVGGGTCVVVNPAGRREPVSFRRMTVSFFLLYRSDDVDVYVVDHSGTVVATLARRVFMRAGPSLTHTFTWRGREDHGRLAPSGRYYVRIMLIHQGRTIDITNSKGLLQWVTVTSSGRCPGAAALRHQ